MEMLIVSGVSGSGKSYAMNVLEDMGYFCVDNIPPTLIKELFKVYLNSQSSEGKLAVVIDCRTISQFGSAEDMLNELDINSFEMKILFLYADDSTILRRYKETRRPHPLMSESVSLEKAIRTEREILSSIKSRADYLIDTSKLKGANLNEKIKGIFDTQNENSLVINTVSFGFKNGIPLDADLLFDVRCLPNPFYIPELKHKTGMDEEVYNYVLSFAQTKALIESIKNYLELSIPMYIKEGKHQLTVCIGCTGGKHRSVTLARVINEYVKECGYYSFITHRDIKIN